VKEYWKYVGFALIVIGAVIAYPFPDLDIKVLGIKNHRYFLFHSAFFPAVVYWIFHRNIESVFSRIIKILISGFSFGLALHLFADVFQYKSIVFPFAKTLIYGTSIDDRLWEGINGFLCFLIGIKCTKRFQKG
jgi:hypothetical protein